MFEFSGRAGRVSAGKCFRLVTKEFYEKCMEPYSIPEFKVRKY
jgi:HrpA-like RNA helicase